MYVPYMKKYEELQYLDKLLPYLELYFILVVEKYAINCKEKYVTEKIIILILIKFRKLLKFIQAGELLANARFAKQFKLSLKQLRYMSWNLEPGGIRTYPLWGDWQ